MDYKEILEKIKKKDPMPHEELERVTVKGFEALKKYDPNMYTKLMHELEGAAFYIEDADAERIVRAMKPFGQVWSRAEIENYLRSKGITEKTCDWYMVMNMVRNDFYNTAKMLGKQDDVEFYYSLARDFITDPDGGPHKVGKYFSY